MKKISREFLFVFILTALGGLGAYFTRIIFARNLSLEEFGLFYAVYALVFFFSAFRDLGSNESAIYFLNKYIAKKDSKKIKGVMILALIPQLVASLVIALIFFLLRGVLVKYYFKTPLAGPILNIMIVLFAFNFIVSFFSNVFLAFQKMSLGKLNDVINFSFIILFSFLFFKVFKIINPSVVPALSYLLANAFTALLLFMLFVFVFRKILREKAVINKKVTNEMFHYAIPIMFSAAGGVILTYSDIILLTLLKGSKLVGLYNVALPSINILLVIFNPLFIFVFPKISRWYHNKNHEKINLALHIIYNYVPIIVIPMSLLFFVYSKTILIMFFGVKFISAANILRVFSIAFIFMFIRNINFSIIAGIGKAKERSIILYYGAIFNVVADLVFIPFFGATGAAIATSLGYILMSFLTFKLILQHYSFKINFMYQLKILIANTIFVAAVYILKNIFALNIYIEFVLVSTISFIVYALVLIVLKVITKEKIAAFRKLAL